MSFELERLREAAQKYSYHDAGTHGVWPRLAWEPRNESPWRDSMTLSNTWEMEGPAFQRWEDSLQKDSRVVFSARDVH
jgi:hypothetical protein